MSETDLNRIRRDLETVKQAAGLGPPFSQEDVIGNLALAACGLLLAAWGVVGPSFWWSVLIPLGLAVLTASWFLRRAYRERAREVSRWREQRSAFLAAAITLPLVVIWMLWERRFGVPREIVGAAAVFFVGAASLVLGLVIRNRRYYLGWAVPLMLFGVAMPFFGTSPRHVYLAAGLCLFLSGIMTAAIQHHQLRTGATNHAAD